MNLSRGFITVVVTAVVSVLGYVASNDTTSVGIAAGVIAAGLTASVEYFDNLPASPANSQ